MKYGGAFEILTSHSNFKSRNTAFLRIELPLSESGHCSRCLQIHISPTTQSFIMRLNSILYARRFHSGGECTCVRRSGLNSAEKLRAFCAQPLAVLFLRTPTNIPLFWLTFDLFSWRKGAGFCGLEQLLTSCKFPERKMILSK
jgi:hypothetical protein